MELFGEVAALKQVVAELRAEIARLKACRGVPGSGRAAWTKAPNRRSADPPAARRGRGKVTPRVAIEQQVVNAPVPPGSRFKGYEPFLVQDLVISVRATCYQRERWVTPDGGTILAPLPEGIAGHFGPTPSLRADALPSGPIDAATAVGVAAIVGRGDLAAAVATPVD